MTKKKTKQKNTSADRLEQIWMWSHCRGDSIILFKGHLNNLWPDFCCKEGCVLISVKLASR